MLASCYFFASRLDDQGRTCDEGSCGSRRRLQGSRTPTEAAPSGSRKRDVAGDEGWPAELRFWGGAWQGELLAGEGLGDRKLGGALRGMMNVRACTHSVPAMLTQWSMRHLLTLTTVKAKARVATSLLQKRLDEVL